MNRMECERCGGDVWRVTSNSVLDDIRSALGSVGYRCTRCGLRRRQRAWPASQFVLAHCSRCYSQHLQVWNRAFVTPSWSRSLVFLLGGSAYRCYNCHHVFVALRPRRLFLQRPSSGRVALESTPPQPESSASDREYTV